MSGLHKPNSVFQSRWPPVSLLLVDTSLPLPLSLLLLLLLLPCSLIGVIDVDVDDVRICYTNNQANIMTTRSDYHD
jgi:hypothetical protein